MVTVEIPEALALELDQLAEAEHKQRTDLVTELLWRDVVRNKQLQAVRRAAGAWNYAEHPELADGGEAYVEAIRSERDERFEDAIRLDQTP
jgi:metal-responsive CopG/Arc/MetJ family transcriptional regulator